MLKGVVVPRNKDYASRNVIRAVMGNEWAIYGPKLDQIIAFLELRASGGIVSEDDIRLSMASPYSGDMQHDIWFDDDGTPQVIDGVQVIKLHGTMAPRMNLMSRFSGGVSTSQVVQQIHDATSNESVKTIVLWIDTPGGTVTGTEELRLAISSAGQSKRVVSSVEYMMASAGYWAGSAAHEIYASPSAEIGSIGVLAIISEETELAKASGVTFTVIRAGEFKAVGNQYEKLSSAGRAKIQENIDTLYDQFKQVVAANRNVSIEEVEANYGRGLVMRAPEALRLGMIDGVATFAEVVARERSRNSERQYVVTGVRKMKVTPKVKAALFASDIVDRVDEDDAVCVAALRAMARNQRVALADDPQEQDLLALFDKPATLAAAAIAEPWRVEATLGSTDSGRTADIQAMAAAFGSAITGPMVAEAIANHDCSLTDIAARWASHVASIETPIGAVPGGSQVDKFHAGLTNALLSRMGIDHAVDPQGLAFGESLQGLTLPELARRTIEINGGRPTGNVEHDARMFLSGGMGSGQHMMVSRNGVTHLASSSYNRAGDHPDALSNLMGKILDSGYQQAPTTFTEYCYRAPDVADFKPQSIIESGIFHELDSLQEDQPYDQLKFESQLKAWFQVERYGDKVGMTVEMVINDNLGVFAQQLASLPNAALKRIDNSCRAMLVANPTLVDGTAMFAGGRGNVATSAAISATSASEHRKLHRLIKGYGSDTPMNLTPNIVLHPAAIEQAAIQVFEPLGMSEPKSPATDATINTVRGMVRRIPDSQLDQYSATAWYTINTSLRPILYTFLRGYNGTQGLRKTWVDQETGTRYTALEIAFGIAPYNWRGTVYNAGA